MGAGGRGAVQTGFTEEVSLGLQLKARKVFTWSKCVISLEVIKGKGNHLWKKVLTVVRMMGPTGTGAWAGSGKGRGMGWSEMEPDWRSPWPSRQETCPGFAAGEKVGQSWVFGWSCGWLVASLAIASGPGFPFLPSALGLHCSLGNLEQMMVSSEELLIPFNGIFFQSKAVTFWEYKFTSAYFHVDNQSKINVVN